MGFAEANNILREEQHGFWKRNILTGTYHLHGQNLKRVVETKYLGVTISQDLNWDTHISNTTNRANKTLGFLRRNLRVGSINIKETAYKALVRPTLEYVSPVWDPHTAKNIDSIEKVQRRAARWVVNDHCHTSSVDSMLTHPQWSTLADRRRAARLTTFKHHREEVSINTPNTPARSTRQSHRETYLLHSCNTNYRKYSFFPRTVRDWNSPPPEVISSTSVECFKSRI
ncbi:uncharacterized protein LOC143290299 [Babylonia areolata]|uniref:uncharacterized protein LOC143290299 n=1 Tax=Babylonia areolata TaxID=304850 RepID=UPI003FD3A797